MTKHLVADISGHGFGHLAQLSAVINQLALLPEKIKITVRSSLPEQIVRSKINPDFNYKIEELDKGMLMLDSISVDADKSYQWYEAFHQSYGHKVEKQAQELEQLNPDLLIADVPYLSLDAAHKSGINAIALCSLNWADIFYTYGKSYPQADAIYEQISTAYNHASSFLCPTPSMPMPAVQNTQSISPIAQRGTNRREALLRTSKAADNTHFVLLSLGGIDTELTDRVIPVMDNIHWIVPDNIASNRADVHQQARFELPYIDILASVDMVVTKTGYGAMVEAVSHQIPLICISRPGWPEEPNLFHWCEENGYFAAIQRHEIGNQRFEALIKQMLEQRWEKVAIKADGAKQAADILRSHLFDTVAVAD